MALQTLKVGGNDFSEVVFMVSSSSPMVVIRDHLSVGKRIYVGSEDGPPDLTITTDDNESLIMLRSSDADSANHKSLSIGVFKNDGELPKELPNPFIFMSDEHNSKSYGVQGIKE